MELGNIIFEYIFNILGGMLIGIAWLGQSFINAGVGKVDRDNSTQQKVIAYSIRIGAAIITLAVLIIVIRVIKASTSVTVLSALALAAGWLTTVYFGRKKLINLRKL